MDEETDVERHFTAADLKDLFTLKEDTVSDTHDSFNCARCRQNEAYGATVANRESTRRYPYLLRARAGWCERGRHRLPAGTTISSAEESDMAQWHHLQDAELITDPILRDSAGDIVTMVFATQSHEKQLGTGDDEA